MRQVLLTIASLISTFSVVCDVSRQNNETPFIINDNSSSDLLFIVDEAHREAEGGPEFGDPKVHYVSQGKQGDNFPLPSVGLRRVSPITEA